jgi:dipeptidyl aminopeptidase/acylaminoacyl peptidase
MAALLTLDPRYFAATGQPAPPIAGMIGLSGAYDFLPLLEADVQDMFGPPRLYPESQPINFVRADSPPMLLVHGLKDETVWPKNSRNLATALRARRAGDAEALSQAHARRYRGRLEQAGAGPGADPHGYS